MIQLHTIVMVVAAITSCWAATVVNIPGTTVIQRNKQLATMTRICKEFDIRFKHMSTAYGHHWRNILHFHTVGTANRVPAVYTRSHSGKRTICFQDVNFIPNYCYHTKKIPLNHWVQIRISQQKMASGEYVYQVAVNGQTQLNIVNRNPKEFTNIKVMGSDKWTPSQAGQIREFHAKCGKLSRYVFNLVPKTEIKKNNQLSTISKICKRFEIEFEHQPTAYESGWRSVLHFFATGTHNRVPAIFTRSRGGLHICFEVSGNANYCYNVRKTPAMQWVRVKISQIYQSGRYVYQIAVNGKVVHSKRNTTPKDFHNVKIVAGDKWYQPQKGYIRGLSARCGN